MLELGPEIGGVADPRLLQISLGLLGDVPRVAAIALPGHGIADGAYQHQGRRLGERIEERRARVGNDQHVAFLDLLKPADRRAVEPDPVLKTVAVERARRHTEVLPQTGKIGEPQIDHRDLVVLDRLQDILGRRTVVGHQYSPITGCRLRPAGAGSTASGGYVLFLAHGLGDGGRG